MTWRRRAGLTALLTFAFFWLMALAPAPAEAARVSPATAFGSYLVAERYWNARGVDPCDGRLIQRAYRRVALGAAPIGPFPDGDPDCWVLTNNRQNWRMIGAWFDSSAREAYCGVVVHERGHNAGFDHTAPGIMNPMLWRVPRICRRAL